MPEANSPLRYPGGKAVLSDFLGAAIEANGIYDCTYVEAYAGGAGAAINLLLAGKVTRIILNDADRCVWSFWRAILNRTQDFVQLIRDTPITVEEWRRQRAIYLAQPRRIVELGFAAFYLNRCNRSGIMTNGGVIGGLEQTGEWKIDARYNRDELIARIERIAKLRDKIEVCQLDAITFLKKHVLTETDRSHFFVYLDPPYYVKGSRLYLNYYEHKDHMRLARFLRRIQNIYWLVTYDHNPEILKMYAWQKEITDFCLHYSAASSKDGSEIMIPSPGLHLPIELLNQRIA
ncbi:MAG: DNA adenine methylase [Opitutae bacterium]|nr:DNA adenine methylase [Opitutae bacterium]